VWICFIWSENLEDHTECGSALYGAEIWRSTQSVGLLYMEWKPGGQRRVRACFIWSRKLEDNAECGSALYGAETVWTTQSVGLLYVEKPGGQR
jgi:hypothetical protein